MREKVQKLMDSCRFGADYYPEHWPRERWETDAKLMRDMGLQVVRMAEFAWHKMEPEKGKFCFDWLDDAIALLGSYGIVTILGTPTAAPPAWLVEELPEVLPIDSQGQQKGFGGRHHDCQSNQAYRGHIRRLVRAMAEHFKNNPYVIGWQIDNELGNSHWDLCMCDSCRAAFQNWLEKKYGTIGALNEAWGTVFWSQTYNSFAEVPVPRKTPTVHNPSLLLDWRRFCSDLVINFQKEQINILREVCPHQQITHNLMGFYDKTNYFQMAQDLDFSSSDQYPTGYYFDAPGQLPYEVAACMDITRCFRNENFWMMEMQSGPTGGGVIGQMPRPGQLQLWTTQAVAHGADTIVYFRWRTCLFGTEQFWHGILPHNGVPGRRYEELKRAIATLTPVMDDTHGIVNKARVAILYSYDQNWALKIQPQHPQLAYIQQVQQYYRAFYRLNIPVDFIPENADFSQYDLVLAPLQYLMTPTLEKKLEDYTAQGGHLLLTMRTGVKNWDNVCMDHSPLPGNLSRVIGAVVEDYDSLIWEETGMRYGEYCANAHKWSDILTCTTGKPLAVYTDGFAAGKPAVVENQFGKGTAYYVGTELDPAILYPFAEMLAKQAGVQGHGQTSESVELTVRAGVQNDYLFVMNHGAVEQQVSVPAGWGEDTVCLKPYEVKILSKTHV